MKYLLSTLILVSAAPALAAQTEGPKPERLEQTPHHQQDRVRGQRGEGRQRGGEERQRPSKEEVLKRFDANGDGKLDESEKARLRKAVEARRSELGRRGAQHEFRGNAKRELPRGKRGDALQRERPLGEGSRRGPRQGEAPRQELRQQRRQELLQRFDANGDGKLDQQERQALKTAMEQRRAAQGEQRPQQRAKRQPQLR